MSSHFLHRAMTIAFLFTLAIPAGSSALPKLKLKKMHTETTADAYNDYLKRVRAMSLPEPNSIGSLWVSSSPLATLSQDYKARNTGDLIIIHLTDNFTAATNGENKQSRQFNANSAITGLVGTIGARNRLQNLFNANSANGLDGKGQSTLSSNVTLNLAAQVTEVLPNGVLVVQAARDITVGNDRQTVLIRGLVRTGDLGPDNSVASTAVSDLEVEIKGKGAVADASRQPNIVIRTLLKKFNF
jgi:flagellar L-ring protein precursor FlgH